MLRISGFMSPIRNQLLAALPQDIQNRLFSHLEECQLPLGKLLYDSGQAMRFVYFPADAIVSMQYMLKDGKSAQIAMIGNEGLVGMPQLMGEEHTPSHAVVQSAGTAYRLKVEILRCEFRRHGEMLELLLRYTQYLMTQTAQTAVCNRHHTLDQQLCRWLLLTLDRLPREEFLMTQEMIANMLGVRREGVTDAASKLQKLGVIKYSRGHITVLDRAHLENHCCECYDVVKNEHQRLLPTAAALLCAARARTSDMMPLAYRGRSRHGVTVAVR